MASITDITIGSTSTSILTAADSRVLSGPIYLKNESGEIISLTIAGADTYALDPGEIIQVLPGQVVTGTAVGGAALLQIIQGIVPSDESASKGGGAIAAAGSAGAAAGRAIWSKGQGDFTTARASATTLTLGAFPTALGTPDDGDFMLVVVTDANGLQVPYVPTGHAMTLSGQTLTVAGAVFDVTDLDYDVLLWGPPKSYDAALNADQAQRLNPEWTHVDSDQKTGSSLGDGTVYRYWDLETYHFWSTRIIDTPGATGSNLYTLEASTLDDGTPQASADYIDRTLDWLGQASFSSTQLAADATLRMWEVDVPKNIKFLRIKMVRSADGGSTDGAYQYDSMWS